MGKQYYQPVPHTTTSVPNFMPRVWRIEEKDGRRSSGVSHSPTSSVPTRRARSFGPVSHAQRPGCSTACRKLAAGSTTCTRRPSIRYEDPEYGNETYLRHSSTMSRCVLKPTATSNHRSRLKLLRMTDIPLPSLPSVFDTGTRTLSNVTNAVPAVAE